MISHHQIQLALRAKLLTLSVATTGSVTLSATANGYARTTGSFLTDGFAPGMEVVPAGFGSNPTSTITSVTALAVTVKDARTAENAGAGRSLTVGLPSLRAWENTNFTPIVGVPYVEEQYIPGPTARLTLGSTSQLEVLPLYSPRIYVPQNTGLGADGGYADALLTLFAPNTTMRLANGDILRVRGDQAPYLGQRYPSDPRGYSVVPVNIPLRLRTANSI